MCTAITFQTKDHYFGRNLDLEFSFGEQVTVTPRNFPLPFRTMPTAERHFAMIGMAHLKDGYPLYYDATNEKGLSMAGLNFPENAYFPPPTRGKVNISPFEFIPWVLGRCADLSDARRLLEQTRLAAIPFSKDLPLSPLHWLLSDREASLTVESTREGLAVFENPIGVLTNNPPFDYHILRLTDFMTLSAEPPRSCFCTSIDLTPYSRGMGAMGLPGDLSSSSRFIRAAFTKLNSVSGPTETESVSQFFHILSSVAQQRGCVRLPDGKNEYTLYSSCCNTDKGIYYYTTYENSRITAVDLNRENLNGSTLISYPLLQIQDILTQN